ncbi:MAG: T9SS type A sorting domain-containing protein [Bacteroidota bacterium]
MKKLLLISSVFFFTLTTFAQTVTTDKNTYAKDDSVIVTYSGGSDPLDWVGIYPEGTTDPYFVTTYSWKYTPGPNGTVKLPTTNVNIPPGNYVVIYLCCDDFTEYTRTSTFTITASTGINELLTEAIQVYPNPNNGNFNIHFALAGNVKITDITGRVVYNVEIENETELSVAAEFSKGIYFVQLITEKGNAVQKIIIE